MDFTLLKSRRILGFACVFTCCLTVLLIVKMDRLKVSSHRQQNVVRPKFTDLNVNRKDNSTRGHTSRLSADVPLMGPLADLHADLQVGTKVPKRDWMPSVDEGVNISETNAANCRYHVLNNGTILKGDIVKIRIDSQDKYNQARFVGGDFWFAWLDSKKPDASTAGKVIDYNNGTYLVLFLAAWTGPANINIILVHPSDATTFMKEVFWNTDDKLFWQAIYQSPHNPKATQTVLCTIESPGIWENKCIYPRPIANGRTSFVCDKPPGLSCSSIAQFRAHNKMITDRTVKILGDKKFLFEGRNYYQKISGNINTLDIKDSSVTFNLERLPNCQPQTPIPIIKGYWMDNQWHSFYCRKYNCWTDPAKVAECLRDKEMHIMGDSNGRQYYNGLIPLLPAEPADVDIQKSGHMFRYIKTYNISMTFDFHPEGLGSHWLKFSEFHYEVDILDQLVNADCNYIILVSTWAHFPQWTHKAIVERLWLLREAVDRLLQRCPGVPIVFKSPHPRSHPSFLSRLISSDFMLDEIRKLLRKIFATRGVFYLDVWDMNLAYPVSNSIHMPSTVINHELFMILSYACNSICKN
ncbi:NXPE family member 3-like [Amphiura filiformis]|uniref:NXPE family member 3-like n=1 Tax=Amphiura filiformis TaxID=82378 RepID=UPI003B211B6D